MPSSKLSAVLTLFLGASVVVAPAAKAVAVYDWAHQPPQIEINCKNKVVENVNIKVSATCLRGSLHHVTVEVTQYYSSRPPEIVWQSGSKEIPLFQPNLNNPKLGGQFWFTTPGVTTQSGNVRVKLFFDGRG